jgi:CIC family chloride channel protein
MSSPREQPEPLDHLGDLTTTARVLPISGLAIAIGVFVAFVAAALLKLIGFFTNLFFFHRFGTALVSPAGHHHLGLWVIAVPVIGALVIGVMARYGSRARILEAERRRERVLGSGLRLRVFGRSKSAA